jgi:SAM-dependent methyltransferase
MSYNSETESCRHRLAKWCVGNGVDLGFGGDPIVPTAICFDRQECHSARSKTKEPASPTHFAWDVSTLPFKDGVLDYVYSSHCLEDFEDTVSVILEWVRVLKRGGVLVLFLPDQVAYEKVGGDNAAHKHKDFSLKYVKGRIPQCCEVVYELFPVENNAYSFDLVVKKI